jgi:hypothetical protein
MNTYHQLLAALAFMKIPTTFPAIFFGEDIYREQARYIRSWLRHHPQRGDMLNAVLLAATALEQLAAFQFVRAESNMRKATDRILAARETCQNGPVQ